MHKIMIYIRNRSRLPGNLSGRNR